jgi:hypothetical protein
MNNIEINKVNLTMTITPDMEVIFKGDPFFLEIEMLQGEREVEPDGRIKYSITIKDNGKIELVKEFCLKLISMSHEKTNNN